MPSTRRRRHAPSVPTITSLRQQQRRVDRRRLSADRVIAAMRNDGFALHCSFERSGDMWWLSNGTRVSPEVAKLLVINSNIVSVGDALFCNASGQTYRFVR
jgi:hypothetical protein